MSIRKNRVPTTREKPQCPFANCTDVITDGASSTIRWKYKCLQCQRSWYQTRPDVAREEGVCLDVKETGLRRDIPVYKCKHCGLPKRGHICLKKADKAAQFNESERKNKCRKCGLLKRGHVCLGASMETMIGETDASFLLQDLPGLYTATQETSSFSSSSSNTLSSLSSSDTLSTLDCCSHCGLTIDSTKDILEAHVACAICNKTKIHIYCIEDMTVDYICDICNP